jgi:hypothetical protein
VARLDRSSLDSLSIFTSVVASRKLLLQPP